MPKTNGQIHREMLMRNVAGATAQTTLGTLEKRYYQGQSGIAGNSLSNQEQVTLRKIITTAGGTPRSNFLSDLYAQACAAKGLPVSKFMNQNKRTLELSL